MEKYWQWGEDFAVVTNDKVPDDNSNYLVIGKSDSISEYANAIGVPVNFDGYQVGVLDFSTNEDIRKILRRAQTFVLEDKKLQAYYLYKILFTRTLPPITNELQRAIHSEACVFFARMAANFGRHGTAYDWYKRAIAADPSNADYRIEMIERSMQPLGLIKTAMIEAKHATEIAPNNPVAWHVLGNTQITLTNAVEALYAFDKQIEVSDRSNLSLLNKISVLVDTEQYEEAGKLCEEVLASGDEKFIGSALHCKAAIHCRYGQHEEAIKLLNEALENELNDKTVTYFHLALSLQAIGRYKEAWHYTALARKNNTKELPFFLPFKRFKEPLFDNQPAPALVHIHTETGAGDNLALMRYLPLLKEKGYKVRFEIRDPMLKLAQDSFKGIEIVPTAKDWPGTFGIEKLDYHLPLLELLNVFETEVDTVPWSGPYLKADPELVKKYENCKGKIGIVWSSGIRHENIFLKRYGQHKSLSFELMKPIIETFPSSFVSLQVGPQAIENNMIPNPLVDNPTWADTAALVENLDLIITPDTAVAHLAGGMGKQCWVMMHAINNTWHFMCERPGAAWNTKSPWYPSVRLFRQKKVGDWDKVVKEIVSELRSN